MPTSWLLAHTLLSIAPRLAVAYSHSLLNMYTDVSAPLSLLKTNYNRMDYYRYHTSCVSYVCQGGSRYLAASAIAMGTALGTSLVQFTYYSVDPMYVCLYVCFVYSDCPGDQLRTATFTQSSVYANSF